MRGAKIDAVHSDGSGDNLRRIKLFRLGKCPTDEMSWSSKDYCTFKNSTEPSRRVAVIL